MVSREGRRVAFAIAALGAAVLLTAGIIARRPLLEWTEEWYTAWKAGDEIRFKVYDVSDLVYLAEPSDRLKISGNDLLASVERKLTSLRAEAGILQRRIMVKATAWDHLKIRKLIDALRVARAVPEP